MALRALLLPFEIGYHMETDVDDHPHRIDTENEDNSPPGNNQGQGNIQGNTAGASNTDLEQELLIPTDTTSTDTTNTGFPTVIKQDGFVSSLMIFLVLLSLSFGTTLAEWITKDQSIRIKSVHVEFMLIAYMLLACAIMWCFCLHRHIQFPNSYILHNATHRHQTPADNGAPESFRKYMQHLFQQSIPLIGILIFFILGIFLDILRIICHIACTWELYDYKDQFIRLLISIIFHILRIVFQSTLIAFAFEFHNKGFRRTTGVRYALLMVLAATLAVWFDSLLYDSRAIFEGHADHTDSGQAGSNSFVHFIAHGNTTANETKLCLKENTKLYQIFDDFSPYLYPLHIEFAVMVCEIIFHLYFSISGKVTCHSNPEVPDRNSTQPTGVPDPQNEQSNTVTDTPTDTRGLQGSPGYGTLTPQTTQRQETTATTVSDRRGSAADSLENWSLPKFLPVTLVFNALLLTLGGLTYLDNDTEMNEEQYNWRLTYEIFKMAYFSGVCVINMIGFLSSTKNCVSDFYPYHGLEYILIVSSLAQHLLAVMDLVAMAAFLQGTESKAEPEILRPAIPISMPIIIIIGRLVNTFQFILQITYTLHVGRLKITNDQTRAYINGVTLMLIITNFTLWASDSFIEVKNSQLEPISSFYYSSTMWGTLSHLVLPFFLFLRINSAFILLGIFFKH